MSTNLKRLRSFALRAAVAAAAAPAILSFSAGTAQANPSDFNPDIWFDPSLGSLTVHIRSWTSDSTHCTYTADWYKRGFDLPAFGITDLTITPSVPQFRSWNVNVTCLNHTGVKVTYFY